MTDKRFSVDDFIKDYHSHIDDNTGEIKTLEEYANLLNKLIEENKELKSDIEYIKQLIKDRIKHYHSYSCIRFPPNEHKGCIGLKMELEKIYDDIDW